MFNLEYLKNVATLNLNSELCTGCSLCITVCPHEVFKIEQKKVHIQNKDACMECGACAKNCKTGAVTVKAGVGCAAAVINSITGKKGVCECNCSC